MATKMIVILLAFTYSGVYLDDYFMTEFSWFTLTGAILGSGLAMYSVIKDLLK